MVNEKDTTQASKLIFVELHMNNGSIISFGFKKDQVKDFLENLRGSNNKLAFDMPWEYENGTKENLQVTIYLKNICFESTTAEVTYAQYEQKAKERMMKGQLYVVNCAKADKSIFQFS